MFEFTFEVKSQRKRWMDAGGDRDEFKELLVRVLLQVAEYWLETWMPLRFAPGAEIRFGYAPRTQKWNRYKSFAKMILVNQSLNHPLRGKLVHNPNLGKVPPKDFVWTGVLEKYVLQKPVDTYLSSSRTTYLGTRPTIKVPVTYPHPLNSRHAGFLTKMIPEEKRDCDDFAANVLRMEMYQSPTIQSEYRISG